jgi:hypothetical protein
MNLNKQYNKWKSLPKSYENGGKAGSKLKNTILGGDIDDLIKKHQDGNISEKEILLLTQMLENYSNTPLPTFENFQKDFFSKSISSGTDFYLYTGLETEEDLATLGGDRFWGNRTLSTSKFNPRDILTRDDITKLQHNFLVRDPGPDGILGTGDDVQVYASDTDLVNPKRIRNRNYITTEGESLFYSDASGNIVPVPDFGGDMVKRDNFLKKLAYNEKKIYDKSHVNIAGCGDNMTCITAGTNMVQNSIEAWNKTILDPKSPYYGLPKIQGDTEIMSAMSHGKFWGPEAERYKTSGFDQKNITRDDFLIEDSEGNMVFNPTALYDFFENEMQIGNIMGVGSRSYGDDRYPGHAISYQGGVFYEDFDGNKIPINFDTEKGRNEATAYFNNLMSQGYSANTILNSIGFLSSNDPTERRELGAPYQYTSTYGMVDFFQPGSGYYTKFIGNKAYQGHIEELNKTEDLYKTIYTDLTKGESNWGRKHISYDPILSEEQYKTSWLRGEEGYIPDEIQGLPGRAGRAVSNFFGRGRDLLGRPVGEVDQEVDQVVEEDPQQYKRGGSVGSSGCSECDAKRLAQSLMGPRSYQNGDEVDMDPNLLTREEYRQKVQGGYKNIFAEDETQSGGYSYYTPYRQFVHNYNPVQETLTDTDETGGNCIHGVTKCLADLGVTSLAGSGQYGEGMGQYFGNQTFVDNAAYEGYIHRADYNKYGIHAGDILQVASYGTTRTDPLGEQIMAPLDETDLKNMSWKDKVKNWLGIDDVNKWGDPIPTTFGTLDKPVSQRKHSYPHHAELVLDKRVNEDGTVDFLISHNEGDDLMKTDWVSAESLYKELDNGHFLLNSYQGVDGLNEIRNKNIKKSNQISGNNDHAYNYQGSTLPYFTMDQVKTHDVDVKEVLTGAAIGLIDPTEGAAGIIDYLFAEKPLTTFNENYAEIGKMSNLPPDILHQLAFNQIGIKHVETGSGSGRKWGKKIIGLLDHVWPGDLHKKVKQKQFNDDWIPFLNDDDISWKEVLYNDGVVNDQTIANEIAGWFTSDLIDERDVHNDLPAFRNHFIAEYGEEEWESFKVIFDPNYYLGKSYKEIFRNNFDKYRGNFVDYLDRENKLTKWEQEHSFVHQEKSKGKFQQKNLSERGRYMRDLLYPNGSGFDNESQQFISSLSLAIDNFHLVKEQYPDFNDTDLINLTTLMHNAPGKAMSRDFVMHFLKGDQTSSVVDYVNNVNNSVSNYDIIQSHQVTIPEVEVDTKGVSGVAGGAAGTDTYKVGGKVELDAFDKYI